MTRASQHSPITPEARRELRRANREWNRKQRRRHRAGKSGMDYFLNGLLIFSLICLGLAGILKVVSFLLGAN